MSEGDRTIFCDDCNYSGPPAAADADGWAKWKINGNGFLGHGQAKADPHQAHCPHCGRLFPFTVSPTAKSLEETTS